MKNNDNQRLERAIEQFIAGDEDAFSEIYDLTKKYLYYTILKSVNAQEVDDILQNTYFDIYKNIKSIREIESFKTWAGIIAHNNISRFYRKNAKFEVCSDEELMTIEEENVDLLPEDAMDNKETAKLIQSFIQELPFVQKQVIVAFYYNQMSIVEIANVMNIPEGTVKTNLYRGKAKIKNSILELERKHGTKLSTVGITTVLFYLFGEEAAACELPKDGLYKVREYQEKLKLEQKELKCRTLGNKSIFDTVVAKIGVAVIGLSVAGGVLYGLNSLIDSNLDNSIQNNQLSEIVEEGDSIISEVALQLAQNSLTVELGSELCIEAKDLIDTSIIDVNRIVIDIGEVNLHEVGTYRGRIQYTDQMETFEVNVVDTIAPSVMLADNPIYVMVGQRCLLNSYIESVEELSGSVEIRLEELSCETGEVQNYENVIINDLFFYAMEAGRKEVMLVATDPSNNESKLSIEIIAINTPIIAISEDVKEFVNRDAAIDYLNTIVALDDIDGATQNGLYYDDTELSEEPGEYFINFFFSDSKKFSTNAIQKIRIVEPPVEEQESTNMSEDKPYWQYGTAVRETSLVLQDISIEIDGERKSFQPDVAFNDPRINGHSYYTNSILGTWSNGTETLVLDAGMFWTNYNPEDDLNGVTFSIGVIVAHQEIEYEGDIYRLYMTGRGSIFMDTDWLQPKGCYAPEMMEEAFGDLSGWIYY